MSILHVRPQRPKPYGRGDGSNPENALNGYEAIPKKLPAGQVIELYGDFGKPDKKTHPFPIRSSGGEHKHIVYRGHKALFPRHYVALTGKNWNRLEGINFVDHGQVIFDRSSYNTLSGCTWSRLNRNALDTVVLKPGSHYNWIAGCSFEWCGNAIYARSRPEDTDPASYLIVEDCDFEHIASGEWAKGADGKPVKDGHAVGIQGGCGHIIRNNDSLDTGTAFCVWAGSEQPMNDMLIEGNKASKCRKMPVEDGTAFKISGDMQPLPKREDRQNIRVIKNKGFDCAGFGVSSNVPIHESDNEFERCKAGEKRIRNPFA